MNFFWERTDCPDGAKADQKNVLHRGYSSEAMTNGSVAFNVVEGYLRIIDLCKQSHTTRRRVTRDQMDTSPTFHNSIKLCKTGCEDLETIPVEQLSTAA